MTDILFTDAEDAMLRQAASLTPDKAATVTLNLAMAFWRAGKKRKFAETFRRAYLLRPTGQIERLSPNYPNVPADEMLDMAQTLIGHGVRYAPVIGALAIAQAQLGQHDAVRRLVDYDRFFHHGTVTLPPGTDSDAFHDAVAAEIKADLKYYEMPGNRAIRHGWRKNHVWRATTPALKALRDILRAESERYVAALPHDDTHPFLAARPDETRPAGWAVVSTPTSYHVAHIHPSAWVTGVYYVTQPEISRGSEEGWLRVGAPRDRGIGEDEGWQTRMIAPVRGSFVLMPAYFYHETEPMGVAQERICIAFETQHGELRSDDDGY